MTPPAKPSPPPGAEPLRLGRYIVERNLAEGGMGEVRVARDEQLQRRVAIKLMHSAEEPGSERLELFEHEARLVARLQHPNVVQVYDYGLAGDDTPYIVMELLDGEDLRRVLERSSPMPLAALCPIIVQAAKGLHAAHRAGIVHHDLKPANLFLARQGHERTVKVLDFGIATVLQTESGDGGKGSVWAGSPAYMSPEQLNGARVDHRTDLWSLAVVAYEALTGVSPFSGASVSHTATRIFGEEPMPPSQRVEGLGPAVDAFFERALAKEPSRRFSSALELAAAFSALDQPQAERPATILVVDDEPDLEELMRQRFRRQVRQGRYELLFARDGHGALDQLALRPDVDVVLTDLNMPGMDGLTLLERLGRAGPALRAVVLTAYGDMGNIRAAMNAGAYDFLTKPVDFADLQTTLDKALRDVRELRRALRSIEENDALRLFVDDALMERLLPLLRISSDAGGDTIDATIVSVHVGVSQDDAPAPQVFARLNRAFDLLVPVVSAWQGVVVRFLGDSLLALFQGPDHLLRAGSACFGMRSARSEAAVLEGADGELSQLRLGIGLDSGPVLSGSIGSKTIQRVDYAVLGATVRHAQQLGKTAEPGQILVRSAIADRLSPSFVSRPVLSEQAADLGEILNVEREGSRSISTVVGALTATVAVDG